MIDRESMLQLACGAKNREQCRVDYYTCLYSLASQVPNYGRIVEIGVYQGDSTIALLCGADTSVEVVSIDPIFSVSGPFTYPDCNNPDGVTLESDYETFLQRLLQADAAVKFNIGRHRLLPMTSEAALVGWGSEIDLLLVDGSHTYENVRQDCKWMEWVKPGGGAAFDDWMHDIRRGYIDHVATLPEGSWTLMHESTSPPEGDLCLSLAKRNF